MEAGDAELADGRLLPAVDGVRPIAFLNLATYFSSPFFFSSPTGDVFCGELMLTVVMVA